MHEIGYYTWQLFVEPELKTNKPRKKLVHSNSPEERVYEPEGVGVTLKKGDEVRDVLVFCFPFKISQNNTRNQNPLLPPTYLFGQWKKILLFELL